ncbi:MAG TPA: A24 family peptidase [Nitrospira sp.]|nr:A24 family peptidase [Nitrospira sp.]
MVIALTLVLATAIWSDLRSGLIPNRLTFSAIGFALLVHGWLGGFQGMLFSLAGLGTGFGLFIICYFAGTMGAGDVKLMAAIGAIVGAYGAFVSGILAILVGGIYALGAMCYQWGFFEMCRKLSLATYGAIATRGGGWGRDLQLPFRLRYGLAIAAGTLLFSFGFHPFAG